ncbi:thiol-disulfide oxidoreductase DCC family protein [Rossellomorea vietnamensis]|uniref:Thiol-disulfide oxidoreductase DCC family protein n=1 Tax=Rossellomorea vietnamensis TaxID=218284 RepID=A0A5D4MES7_9BACI|nr:thiol-disulfide oxidoreductase DCC family protein [Rossellomorea vietnamensis]TYS00400.1 thiol-disulfide oxidoreductase DCC family protein [Rossellomorea vietnamensis]
MGAVILFDGVCNLCNNTVQFIIKRDDRAYFKFASLQSDAGKVVIEKFQINPKIDSIILIEQNKFYVKSEAALRVSKNLGGFWKVFFVFMVIPKKIRDKVYDFIAQNRYKWFGKRDSCMLPSSEMKKRFLE